MNTDQIAQSLSEGEVVVLRTDTLYGLLAKVGNQEAVEKIYSIKERQSGKPCIILVSDISAIPFDQEVLEKVYAEAQGTPTSIVIPVTNEPEWVTRGSVTIAYRVPQNEDLKKLLQLTGPLIAPSANPEGLAPAKDIQEAKEYFGERVALYIDGGEVPENTPPSQIVVLDRTGARERLR